MQYITVDSSNGPNWKSKKCCENPLFEFSLDKEDYFLNVRLVWRELSGKFYTFKLGNREFKIPSGFYVLIGDYGGHLDWICVDELIDLPVEIVVLSASFKEWRVEEPQLVNVEEDIAFWPSTDNVVPMEVNNRAIILSDKDRYQKTKSFYVDSFLV